MKNLKRCLLLLWTSFRHTNLLIEAKLSAEFITRWFIVYIYAVCLPLLIALMTNTMYNGMTVLNKWYISYRIVKFTCRCIYDSITWISMQLIILMWKWLYPTNCQGMQLIAFQGVIGAQGTSKDACIIISPLCSLRDNDAATRTLSFDAQKEHSARLSNILRVYLQLE